MGIEKGKQKKGIENGIEIEMKKKENRVTRQTVEEMQCRRVWSLSRIVIGIVVISSWLRNCLRTFNGTFNELVSFRWII